MTQGEGEVPALDAARVARCHSPASDPRVDQRGPFEIDRDRILYSSAFHRLAGVTQIVRAGELDIFHTRQQHTYKVGQIGRRLAENCIREQASEAKRHGLHPEVVEAACLAHDLGHPPFGHAAETELDIIVRDPMKCGGRAEDACPDGYEGNAQTFRILTKLAVRYGKERPGLDLTRATLAATLKYPWLRDLSDLESKKGKKWSAYRAEQAQFEWAREHCHGDFKSAEAELMDWADDIAYSVHDLEDFHRVGVIQWSEIVLEGHQAELIEGAVKVWKKDPDAPADVQARTRDALARIQRKLKIFPTITQEVYDGSREQRRQLRNFTSQLIGPYVRAARLSDPDAGGPNVIIDDDAADEVRLLKYFARRYVIGLPALHAQQHGQRRLVRDLFEIFLKEGKAGNFKLFPARLRYIWEDNADPPARLAADCIAGLTENEAYQLHRRLIGSESGLVLDPIVR